MIREFKNKFPNIYPTVYIDDSAVIIGDVIVGKDSSLWPMTIVRGDIQAIKIGNALIFRTLVYYTLRMMENFLPGRAFIDRR